MNRTLKYLDFVGAEIPPTVWRGISRSALTELKVRDWIDCHLNDESAYELFSGLANNATMKKLILPDAKEISSVGWVACFQHLLDSQSALEILNFSDNEIDDEGASVLASLLGSHMSNVVSLTVQESLITTHGLTDFANVLAPNSTSKLKILRLPLLEDEYDDDVFIDLIDVLTIMDDVLIEFIATLSNNTSLCELDLGERGVSKHTLDVLANVLCDKTSIANVCSSNHSLNILYPNYYGVVDGNDVERVHHDELDVLLDMNKNPDKVEVIRTKLLTYFFSNADNIVRGFGSVDTTVMPNVMEWIGRDRLGYSVMFELCRSMPELFKE
jgi:hypothetical protein